MWCHKSTLLSDEVARSERRKLFTTGNGLRESLFNLLLSICGSWSEQLDFVFGYLCLGYRDEKLRNILSDGCYEN